MGVGRLRVYSDVADADVRGLLACGRSELARRIWIHAILVLHHGLHEQRAGIGIAQIQGLIGPEAGLPDDIGNIGGCVVRGGRGIGRDHAAYRIDASLPVSLQLIRHGLEASIGSGKHSLMATGLKVPRIVAANAEGEISGQWRDRPSSNGGRVFSPS